jgi:hypothetical protein
MVKRKVYKTTTVARAKGCLLQSSIRPIRHREEAEKFYLDLRHRGGGEPNTDSHS